jgi:hypothetical protein
MSVKANPFHIEAVATYGNIVRTATNLDYMRRAGDELTQYLVAYPDSKKRYGAAVGLRGGHGSGKTHLLMWLSEQAIALQKIQPIVLYAKADRSTMFDLYTQMLSDLSREKLLEILDQALRGVAKHDVRKAKVTESLGTRLEQPDSLTTLEKEGNIDLDTLHVQMQALLEDPNTQIPVEIPRAVTQLADPAYGEKIYQWLFGKSVPGLEDIRLDHPLLQLQPETKDILGPDVAAVNVLETIAALLRLAERPLVVLIDQLEVLLRADAILKKLIEQLNRQSAITFIAGNDRSWQMLPPDVPPRLRLRQPIRVGNLNLGETRSLVEAYMPEAKSFSEKTIESIHSLSGGNPREVIRISYYAFQKTGGDLARASADVFVQSANESGSVAERARRALEIADQVLKEEGPVVKDLSAGDSILIDRMLRTENRPRLALLVVKPTDKLSEIDSARRINHVRGYIENTWVDVPLICVGVGYSSDEIRSLFEAAATFIEFREVEFAADLKTKLIELLARQASAQFAERSGADPAVLEALTTIASRLDKFEAHRTEDVKNVAERFAAKTEALDAAAEKARESQTRWDFLNQLDKIQRALDMYDIEREHELMRSLLVANEVSLKRRQLDYLGGIYLDIVSAEINWRSRKSEYDLGTIGIWVDQSGLPRYRFQILGELRRLLRNPRVVDRWLEKPFLSSTVAAAVLLGLEFLIIYIYARFFYAETHYYTGYYPADTAAEKAEYFARRMAAIQDATWRFWWPMSIVAALLTVVVIGATTIIVRWYRRLRWERLAKRVSANL